MDTDAKIAVKTSKQVAAKRPRLLFSTRNITRNGPIYCGFKFGPFIDNELVRRGVM